MSELKYKRILIKFSGEALRGSSTHGIDPNILDYLAKEIGALIQLGVQVASVIGGGNLFRGEELSKAGIGRITGDHMGMLATLMNSLALRDGIERAGLSARIMSAIPMSGIVDHYDRRKATYYLQEDKVVIFAAGTGNPLVTTDSAASLRAIEIDADILIKSTNVDGVYDVDPKTSSGARKYDKLTYDDVIKQELGVMDLAAFTQCRDHQMKIQVISLHDENSLIDVVNGRDVGTLIG